MIPVRLTVPVGPGGPRPVAGRVLRLVALVAALGAMAGLMAWLVTLSPLQLERWSAIETSHYVTFEQAGTYLIFEEGAGAAGRRGAPLVVVGVRSLAGRPVPVRSLVDSQGRSERTYDIRLHEGRAIAAVDVDRPGRYLVLSFSSSALEPADRARRRSGVDVADLPGLALGAEGEPSSWGTWTGLAVLVAGPAVAGLGLAVGARLRYPVALGPVVRRLPPRR